MNKLRKVFVMFATLALILSMSCISFAAPIGNGVSTSSDTTLTIPKGVTFINADAVTSYGPGVTFTYTVAPTDLTDGAMTIKDADGHTTTVHSGPTGGLTLASSSVTFGSNETFTTSASGVQATKDITLNVDLSKFSKPGVYRYTLTDTTDTSTLYAAGVTRDDNYQTTRYIDVFVYRNTETGAFYVGGYALKTDNSSTNGKDAPTTVKDPGYVSSSAVEDGDPANTDRYETYNVTLTKVVTGGLGDKNHEFPFAITVANQSKNYQAAKGNVDAAKAATADAATSKSTTLKDGETYTLVGLSPKATVAYQETNDTTDLYTVTVNGSSSSIAVTEDATNKTYAIAAGSVSTYDTDNSATTVNDLGSTTNYSAVTYTNDLAILSPTGFAQRWFPYVAMLIGAMLLSVISRRLSRENN